MPEEDDDALGAMLGERLKESASNAGADDGDGSSATKSRRSTAAPDTAESTESGESTESTESMQLTSDEDDSPADEPSSGEEDEADTARSRSPFPLYITPGLKEDVQNRFEKFNAQRTLDDEPQVEKHRHFMEGLLRAGLDHPDLEEYVLAEFEER